MRCRSKNKPYCRYHGVPQPEYAQDLQQQLEDLNDDIYYKATTRPFGEDLPVTKEEFRELAGKKREAALKLAAVLYSKDKDAAQKVLKKSKIFTMPGDLKEAVKARRRQENEYIRNLAEQTFKDEEERTVALKGSPALFAHSKAVEAGYPTEEEPYTTDGETYTPGRDAVFDTKVKALENWADKRGLSVIKARVGVMGVARVPFNWKEYGVSQKRYNQLRNDKKFQAELNKFEQAKRNVRNAVPVTIN